MTTPKNTHHSSNTLNPRKNPRFWQAFAALMEDDLITADALIEEGVLGEGSTTNSKASRYQENCTTAIWAVHDQIQRGLEPNPCRSLTLSQREIGSLLRLYAIETEIISYCGYGTPATLTYLSDRTHRAVKFFNAYISL